MYGVLMLRTFLIFFLGGLLLTAGAISLFMIGDMVRRHCVNDNPDLTCGDALFFSVASPIYAVLLGMGLNFLPLLVAAVMAVLGRAFFKHVPLWLLIVILPACMLAFVVQGTPFYPQDNMRPMSERLVVFAGFQALCLLLCWWWDRRGE